MSNQALLLKLTEAVVEGSEEKAKAAVDSALNAGVDPLEIMQIGVAGGMERIGKMFQDFEVYLPELMLAADIGKACLEQLAPHMTSKQSAKASLGKIILGTVTGDVHDIGKNLVGAVLAASGFEVYDLGVDVPPLNFVKKAEEVKATIIGLSSLLTTSLPYQKDLVNYLNDMGLRQKYYVVVGGGPVTPEWAGKIKTDGYARLATEAVDLCRQLVACGKKPPLDSPIIIGSQTND
ncbi:MAG: corrinoid protein [Deltaproteobacteria bacterium]|nr:corrinoid protein [Deltaproteobacteria bacterium]